MFLLNKNFSSSSTSHLLIFFLYLSLLVGLIFGENSTGGAFLDYINQKQITLKFSKNFFETLLNYDSFTTRHSPILLIILSQLEQIVSNDFIIRFIYLHFCLLLPITFFKILKLKFKNIEINKEIFIFLSLLIFLSPVYRSLSIWPDSRIIGLTFFIISIYFFQKFINKKKHKYIYKNILFYTIAAYFSPNFSVISIFFIYKYFKFYGISKKFFEILILNLILALPAFYYVFYLDINFLNKSAALDDNLTENIFFKNIFNQFLIIPSIFFFYLFPFIYFKILEPHKKNMRKAFFISLPIFFLSILFFDYQVTYTGGGIFYKISHFFFENNFLFYFFAFISLVVTIIIFIDHIENSIIFILLFLNNPQITVYHKYYDPMLIIFFFCLFSFKINVDKLSKFRNIVFLYLYFLIFLIINLLKFKL